MDRSIASIFEPGIEELMESIAEPYRKYLRGLCRSLQHQERWTTPVGSWFHRADRTGARKRTAMLWTVYLGGALLVLLYVIRSRMQVQSPCCCLSLIPDLHRRNFQALPLIGHLPFFALQSRQALLKWIQRGTDHHHGASWRIDVPLIGRGWIIENPA